MPFMQNNTFRAPKNNTDTPFRVLTYHHFSTFRSWKELCCGLTLH